MEKILKPFTGLLMLLIAFISLGIGIYLFVVGGNENNPGLILPGVLFVIIFIFIVKGLVAVSPNYGITVSLFGKYVGTIKQDGLQFVNPLYTKLKVDLRARSLESTKLKVNDKLGNPIEIAAVLVWQIQDTYKAVFDVSNFNEYVKNQSEAALRHLATSYPYDNIEDESAHITLRDGGEKVIEMLELNLMNA